MMASNVKNSDVSVISTRSSISSINCGGYETAIEDNSLSMYYSINEDNTETEDAIEDFDKTIGPDCNSSITNEVETVKKKISLENEKRESIESISLAIQRDLTMISSTPTHPVNGRVEKMKLPNLFDPNQSMNSQQQKENDSNIENMYVSENNKTDGFKSVHETLSDMESVISISQVCENKVPEELIRSVSENKENETNKNEIKSKKTRQSKIGLVQIGHKLPVNIASKIGTIRRSVLGNRNIGFKKSEKIATLTKTKSDLKDTLKESVSESINNSTKNPKEETVTSVDEKVVHQKSIPHVRPPIIREMVPKKRITRVSLLLPKVSSIRSPAKRCATIVSSARLSKMPEIPEGKSRKSILPRVVDNKEKQARKTLCAPVIEKKNTATTSTSTIVQIRQRVSMSVNIIKKQTKNIAAPAKSKRLSSTINSGNLRHVNRYSMAVSKLNVKRSPSNSSATKVQPRAQSTISVSKMRQSLIPKMTLKQSVGVKILKSPNSAKSISPGQRKSPRLNQSPEVSSKKLNGDSKKTMNKKSCVDNELICDICNKEFRLKSSLLTHKKTHDAKSSITFKCSFCDKIFDIKTGLDRHIEKYCTKIPVSEKRKLLSAVESTSKTNIGGNVLRQNSIRNKTQSTTISTVSDFSINSSSSSSVNQSKSSVNDKSGLMMAPPPPLSASSAKKAHSGVIFTPNRDIKCYYCKLQFGNISTFVDHIQTHSFETEENKENI